MIKVLKTYYKFIFQKKLPAGGFLALAIISPLVSAILPYFYKLFVDAITAFEFEKLLGLLLLYVFLNFADQILNALTYLVGDLATFDAGIKARVDVFAKIHELDFAYHANKSSGSLISTIKRGDNAFWDLHHSIHFNIVPVVISFSVMMLFFLSLDPMIFLISLFTFLLALLVTRFFIKINIRTRNRFNAEEDKISGVIVDNMIGFETVKIFAKEAWEKSRLQRKFRTWKKALWDFALTFRFLDLSMATVMLIGLSTTLYFSLKATVSGQFSPGDFVLVVGFTASFYPKLFNLVWGLRRIARNYTDIQKYFNVLELETLVKDPTEPKTIRNLRGEIKYEKVNFAYGEKEKDALRNINLLIREGQSVALVGRSGSGKTTMVKLLMRFYDVQKGVIRIDNIDIKKFKKDDLRSNMGLVPQEPVLFNHSIRYNIAYGLPRSSQKEVEAAAKMAHIHDFIKSLPKGYRTKVGERGIKLSGGQKQRIAIARMILSNPEIVIFDEATSQLDSESEKLIQDAFWKAVRNKTTIIIAHRLSTVKRADKIVVMENGRVMETGSHQSLIQNKNGLYRHFWELQVIE